ncbi:MAG TPA: VOC family protein [Candidatus Acidoferrales bacterium]|nr:VOC family protein [Candidatus Acidoferrales bacterium]
MELKPYIFLYGRCEEALEFYKPIFDGSYEISRNADGPMADRVPQDWRNKVMHASFTSPGVSFLASDGRESKTIDPDAGNIALCVEAKNAADGERICKSLADGGKINMPFGDAFWGGKFGNVIDRFGNEWMVTAQ